MYYKKPNKKPGFANQCPKKRWLSIYQEKKPNNS